MTQEERLSEEWCKPRYRAPLAERLKVWFRNLPHWPTGWAVWYLSRQLQRDKAFRDAWQANIAMPIYDATRPQCLCDPQGFTGHYEGCPIVRMSENGTKPVEPMHAYHCNVIADRLLRHLFEA